MSLVLNQKPIKTLNLCGLDPEKLYHKCIAEQYLVDDECQGLIGKQVKRVVKEFMLFQFSYIDEPDQDFFEMFTENQEDTNKLSELKISPDLIVKRILYAPKGTAIIQLNFLKEYYGCNNGKTELKSFSLFYFCLEGETAEPWVDIDSLKEDKVCEVPYSLEYSEESKISKIGEYYLVPYSFEKERWYPTYSTENYYYCLEDVLDIDIELKKFVNSLQGLSNQEIRNDNQFLTGYILSR